MAEILDKIADAEVLLMATPVYFLAMNGQLKTLIDRTVPKYMQMKDKDVYFIATAALNDKSMLERTIDGFRGFIDCYEDFREKGSILATGIWNAGEINTTDYIITAYEMGKSV